MSTKIRELLLLGVGPVASAIAIVARKAGYTRILGTTRDATRAPTLEAAGIEPIILPLEPEQLAAHAKGRNVLVAFSPTAGSDSFYAQSFNEAANIVYISATTVYGATTGVINDETEVPTPVTMYAKWRLGAEAAWREKGSITLRIPGFYGEGVGLHEDLRAGYFRIPGEGKRMVSLIHLEDLGRIVVAAFDNASHGETFVVGDNHPATQVEIVTWLCEAMKLPMVPSIPDEMAHFSLKADRAIDSSRLLKTLGVSLRFPTYKDGFSALLAA